MVRKKTIDIFFCFVTAAILGFSGTVTFAGGGSETVDFQTKSSPGTDYLVGPTKIKDKRNKTSFNLPKGWYAVVPKPGAKNGLISIANYDIGLVENTLSERSSNTFLSNMVKIDLKISDLAGKSKEKWIEDQYRSVITKINRSSRTWSKCQRTSGNRRGLDFRDLRCLQYIRRDY